MELQLAGHHRPGPARSIGKSYEEAAADLGASRLRAIWRVLLPMLMPAVFASAVLVFAGVIDDFVIVDQLSSTAETQPMSVLIYSRATPVTGVRH